MSIYKRIREYSLNPPCYWKISFISHAFLHFLCLTGLTIGSSDHLLKRLEGYTTINIMKKKLFFHQK